MEMWMLVMRAAWLITAIGAIHIGAMEVGIDMCTPWHQYMRPVNIIIGVAGVVSLVAFFMMLSQG